MCLRCASTSVKTLILLMVASSVIGAGAFCGVSTETLKLLSSAELLNFVRRFSSIDSPWAFALEKHAAWGLSVGKWIALQGDEGTCVAHLIPNEGNDNGRKVSLWRLKLWLLPQGKALKEENPLPTRDIVWKTTKAAADFITQSLPPETQLVKISVAALDRKLLTPVTKALEEDGRIKMERDYVSQCGLYGLSSAANNLSPPIKLSGGFKFRALSRSDAHLVNSKWEYKSLTSLSMVTSMIDSDDCCCLGAEDNNDGELCAWILQYQDGPLGMLWCQENYRRKGIATALVAEATKTLAAKGETQAFTYIVDGNQASQELFERLGWKRLCHADWVGFSSQRLPKKETASP